MSEPSTDPIEFSKYMTARVYEQERHTLAVKRAVLEIVRTVGACADGTLPPTVAAAWAELNKATEAAKKFEASPC